MNEICSWLHCELFAAVVKLARLTTNIICWSLPWGNNVVGFNIDFAAGCVVSLVIDAALVSLLFVALGY